jgi:hypothetical protein
MQNRYIYICYKDYKLQMTVVFLKVPATCYGLPFTSIYRLEVCKILQDHIFDFCLYFSCKNNLYQILQCKIQI